MTIKEFIANLEKSNFTLAIKNGKLILKGDKKKLTKDEIEAIKTNQNIINYIKDHKNELIEYLLLFSKKFSSSEKKSKDISSIYRLSGLQQGMLFHGLYDEGAVGAYIEQFSCELINPDLEVFTSSWQWVLQRHSILRSAFYADQFRVPVQCVYQEVQLPIEVLDYSGMSEEEQIAAIKRYKEADQAKGFDFKEAPLMRLALLRLSEERYHMLWTFHHILLDGWSKPVVVQEFLTIYEVLQAGQQVVIEEEDRYEDYIRYIERSDKEPEEKYWKAYLQGVEHSTLLPFIGSTAERTKGMGVYQCEYLGLDAALTEKIQGYAQRHSLTVNTLMQGVWAYLLHRYTGNSHVVYGVVVSGRPDDLIGVEQRIGMYINTLPLHSRLQEEVSVVEWLQSLQQGQVESRQYQHTALSDIQKWTGVMGDWFDTLLTFENYPVSQVLSSRKWSLQVEQVQMQEQTNYPLSVIIGSGEQINIQFSYNSVLLQEAYVRQSRLILSMCCYSC
jgi:hypothetical protein